MKHNRLFALILSLAMLLSLLTACGKKEEEKDVDLSALWTSIMESVEMPSLMELDDETLQLVYGIDPADLESYVARMPFMNVQATEFFLARVKDGKMDTVKEAIEGRQADLVELWSRYLPDQFELVKNYQLVVNGSYVLFCVCGDPDTAVKLFNEATA